MQLFQELDFLSKTLRHVLRLDMSKRLLIKILFCENATKQLRLVRFFKIKNLGLK